MPVVILDQVHWAQLEHVQLKIDAKVVFQTDQRQFGQTDYWEPAGKKGDCEDIALAKRARLMALGWPAEDLRIAVVLDENNQLHAVLTVDVVSVKGRPATYVLDSRFAHVEPWKRLSDYGYTWVERAKPGSAEWRRVEDGGAMSATLIASTATLKQSPADLETAAPAGPAVAAQTTSGDPIGDLLASLPPASPAGVEGEGHRSEGLAEGVAGAVGSVPDLDAPVDVAQGGLHAALAPADADLAVAHKGA
jgi:predicted transglutaminase-like cysteine proteinase